MHKFILASRFGSLLAYSLSRYSRSHPSKFLFSLLGSSFSTRAFSSPPDLHEKNSVLADYLTSSLKFSKDKAHSISTHYSRIKSLENPEQVVRFFKGLGFSDKEIQSIANGLPSILFADVEKTLKPKFVLFQGLGLSGPHLAAFASRNICILTHSLERSLQPCIRLIKEVLKSDGRNRSDEKVNNDLFLIVARYNRIFGVKRRIEANIHYLESCGVVGSQLSSLLVRQPRIFGLPKEKLEELVSRAVDMNFSMGSRMMALAIHMLSCVSVKTLNGRFQVLRMFGFSKDEVDSMFRTTPKVFGISDENLRSKAEFFLFKLKIDRKLLIRNPPLLGFSLEGRVIPRCRVIEILVARGLSNEGFSFTRAMFVSNQQFLEKYILPFENEAEELLGAYRGKLVDSSK